MVANLSIHRHGSQRVNSRCHILRIKQRCYKDGVNKMTTKIFMLNRKMLREKVLVVTYAKTIQNFIYQEYVKNLLHLSSALH